MRNLQFRSEETNNNYILIFLNFIKRNFNFNCTLIFLNFKM